MPILTFCAWMYTCIEIKTSRTPTKPKPTSRGPLPSFFPCKKVQVPSVPTTPLPGPIFARRSFILMVVLCPIPSEGAAKDHARQGASERRSDCTFQQGEGGGGEAGTCAVQVIHATTDIHHTQKHTYTHTHTNNSHRGASASGSRIAISDWPDPSPLLRSRRSPPAAPSAPPPPPPPLRLPSFPRVVRDFCDF